MKKARNGRECVRGKRLNERESEVGIRGKYTTKSLPRQQQSQQNAGSMRKKRSPHYNVDEAPTIASVRTLTSFPLCSHGENGASE